MARLLDRPTTDTPSPEPAGSGGWMRRFYPFLKPHMAKVGIALFASIVSFGLRAVVPRVTATVYDRIASGDAIGSLLWILGAIAVVSAGLSVQRRYWGGRVGFDLDFTLRTAIFDHMQRLDFANHAVMQTGQIVARATQDVSMVQRLFMFGPFVLGMCVMFFASIGFMLTLSWKLTIVTFTVVPVMMVISLRMRRTVYPAAWVAQHQEGEVAQVVEDVVSGVRVVKGFGQEIRELQRLIVEASNLYAHRMRNVRLQAKFQPALTAMPRLGQLFVVLYGGYMVFNGEITLGTFLAFNVYLLLLLAPVQVLSFFLPMMQMVRASGERILELLDSTPRVEEPSDPVALPGGVPSIEFKSVTFGYMRSEPVLSELNVSIAPGEKVAFVGASGCGKTTVTMLVPRFYDVQEGAIAVDGIDLRSVSTQQLRSRIGMVFEEAFLFSDTIRENIAYGNPEATMEQVEAAARAAGAHGFISALPDGYETTVGERGLTLSGGQRQRISLARALLTRPDILILDDATSAVDPGVEAEIHETLREQMEGRTTIIIAHRRSTLDLADRIVVLDKGRVVADGTHDDLQRECRLYRELLAGPDDDIDTVGELPEHAEPDSSESSGATANAWPAEDEAGPKLGDVAQMRFGGPGGGEGIAASEQLLLRISELPPADDKPIADVNESQLPDPEFSLRRLLYPWRRRLLVSLAVISISTIASVIGPEIIQRGIDGGIAGGNLDALWTAGVWFGLAVLVTYLVGWIAALYAGRTAEDVLFSLRIRVFAQLQRLGMDFYEREMAGRIMTRMTSDIDALGGFVQSGLITVVMQALTFVFVASALVAKNPVLALVTLGSVPLLAWGTIVYERRSTVAYNEVREQVSQVNADFQESVSGVRVAKAFAREEHNRERFRRVAGDYLEARISGHRLQALFMPFVELVNSMAEVLVLAVGATLVQRGDVTQGELIAFMLYLTTVFAPIQQLSQQFDAYQQARAAFAKIRALLAEKVSIVSPPKAANPTVRGRIQLEGVSFKYPKATTWALQGVDLEIAPGDSVALVGETGAGKSTIVKLLARFYDVDEGTVRIDGEDIRNLDLVKFRQQIGFVPQEAFLFAGSVRDNIAYGRPDATDAEVEQAARAVGAHDFIASLSRGYRTVMSERGRSISSGQRQLIALARALLVDPAILLLDEATSNLDLSTEAMVTKAMGVATHGRTSILIAHRLATARRADRILVIHDGGIVEDGTHDELLGLGGRYAHLWNTYETAARHSA